MDWYRPNSRKIFYWRVLEVALVGLSQKSMSRDMILVTGRDFETSMKNSEGPTTDDQGPKKDKMMRFDAI